MFTPESEETSIPPLLAPHERPSVEQVAKIHAALELTRGDTKAAGEVLGLSKIRVIGLIKSTPVLQTRWGTDQTTLDGGTHINEVTTINRTPPEPMALTESQKTAIALSTTERKLNKSLAKLGFKSKEIEAISAVEEFAGQHFEQTLSIMHGGLLKSAMRLMILAERIEGDYLQNDSLDEKEKKWWWDQYFRILEKLRDMTDQTNKSALTRALIDIKRKAGNGLGKPGFSTPAVAIQINNGGPPRVQTSGQTGEPLPPE